MGRYCRARLDLVMGGGSGTRLAVLVSRRSGPPVSSEMVRCAGIITPIPRKNPPLLPDRPVQGGGVLSRKSQNLKIFRLRRAFLINFEYSLLPETRILVIFSCAKTCFPDTPDVFSSVRARLYHSQALQAAQTCA